MRTYDEKIKNKILDFILKYQKEHNLSPSYRMIVHKLGLASPSMVHRYVNILEAEGLVYKNNLGGLDIPKQLKVGRTVQAPVVGKVACGEFSSAIENIEATVDLPTFIFGDGETYVLQANGNSMIDAGIDSGDWLVVKKDTDFANGDIIIAWLDGEATAKRVYIEKDHVVLHPENKRMKDIILDNKQEIQYRGRVVNVIKTVTRFKSKE